MTVEYLAQTRYQYHLHQGPGKRNKELKPHDQEEYYDHHGKLTCTLSDLGRLSLIRQPGGLLILKSHHTEALLSKDISIAFYSVEFPVSNHPVVSASWVAGTTHRYHITQRVGCDETLSSGHGITVALMDSKKPW